jgi:hypothetical protein
MSLGSRCVPRRTGSSPYAQISRGLSSPLQVLARIHYRRAAVHSSTRDPENLCGDCRCASGTPGRREAWACSCGEPPKETLQRMHVLARGLPTRRLKVSCSHRQAAHRIKGRSLERVLITPHADACAHERIRIHRRHAHSKGPFDARPKSRSGLSAKSVHRRGELLLRASLKRGYPNEKDFLSPRSAMSRDGLNGSDGGHFLLLRTGRRVLQHFRNLDCGGREATVHEEAAFERRVELDRQLREWKRPPSFA